MNRLAVVSSLCLLAGGCGSHDGELSDLMGQVLVDGEGVPSVELTVGLMVDGQAPTKLSTFETLATGHFDTNLAREKSPIEFPATWVVELAPQTEQLATEWNLTREVFTIEKLGQEHTVDFVGTNPGGGAEIELPEANVQITDAELLSGLTFIVLDGAIQLFIPVQWPAPDPDGRVLMFPTGDGELDDGTAVVWECSANTESGDPGACTVFRRSDFGVIDTAPTPASPSSNPPWVQVPVRTVDTRLVLGVNQLVVNLLAFDVIVSVRDATNNETWNGVFPADLEALTDLL